MGNKLDKYIFIEHFPCNNEKINDYLMTYKNELMSRKIKVFNGALECSFRKFEMYRGTKKIHKVSYD